MRVGPPPRRHQYATIAMMLLMLVVIVTMRRQCAEGTASLFKAMDVPQDGGAGAAHP